MKIPQAKYCFPLTALVVVVGARSGAAQQPYVADSGTALLYHLDESAGSTVALDASSNGRNATIGTGLTIGQPGQNFFGNAIQSSAGLTRRAYWTDTGKGTTSFLYPKTNSSFTLECWVKMGNTTFTPSVILAASQPTGSPQYDYLLTIASSSDATRPRGLIFRDMGHFRVNTGALTWDTNTWYHVAVVVQQGATSSTYTLYRTPAGTTTPTQVATATGGLLTPSTLTNDRVISVSNFYADSGNDYFPGLVDEFRYSTVARSTDDLKLTLGPSTAARIRAEVGAPNSETDHPMPLISPWSAGQHGYIYLNNTGANGGQNDEGFSPAWQLAQINAGHQSVLTFSMPEPIFNQTRLGTATWNKWLTYYQASIQAAAAQKLPIAFVASQWESLFYADTADYTYFKNAWPNNPNVMIKTVEQTSDGPKDVYTPQKKVSPFGPVSQWEDVGQRWATSQMMQLIQTWYPDPPAVFFISNNEAPRLRAAELATIPDANYTTYDPAKSMDYQKLAIGRGWIQRYRALQNSWKNNLTAQAWKDNSKFIAYGAFGPSFFQRANGWANASQYVNPADPDVSNLNPEWHIDPHHRFWDGGAVDNYLTSNYTANADYKVFSPQIESMNYEFMRREVMQQEPNFWLELVTWTGCDFWPPNAADGTCAGKLCSFSPAYTLPRYAGMVQFSMWILRPRVIRDNRGWATKRADSQPYYDQLVAAVDHVYASPTLQSFWRNSELVPNAAHSHPYRVQMASEYQNTERMYLLSTNLDPTPWNTTQVPGLATELQVYALARVKGAAGARQWLVYAFAPKAGATTPVSTTITIPGYQNITVDATVGGSFYLVSESSGTVQAVS